MQWQAHLGLRVIRGDRLWSQHVLHKHLGMCLGVEEEGAIYTPGFKGDKYSPKATPSNILCFEGSSDFSFMLRSSEEIASVRTLRESLCLRKRSPW